MTKGQLLEEPRGEFRILALIGKDKHVPQKMTHKHFNGVIVDAHGSMKVGQTVVHPNELAPAIVGTVRLIDDAAEEVAPSIGESVQKVANEVFSDPFHLETRVTVFEEVVQDRRDHPNIPVTSR